MLEFLYNMDPVIIHLENRLTGIHLYSMPVAGPVLAGEPSIPPVEDKFSVKGYADDLKVALKTMAEFLLLDMILSVFVAASGFQVHRDPGQDKCKVLLLGNWKHLKQEDIPVNYLRISDFLDMLGVTIMATITQTRKVNGDKFQKQDQESKDPLRDHPNSSFMARLDYIRVED